MSGTRTTRLIRRCHLLPRSSTMMEFGQQHRIAHSPRAALHSPEVLVNVECYCTTCVHLLSLTFSFCSSTSICCLTPSPTITIPPGKGGKGKGDRPIAGYHRADGAAGGQALHVVRASLGGCKVRTHNVVNWLACVAVLHSLPRGIPPPSKNLTS